MNFIEVNGTALRYELSGHGASTLVLIHEMGGTLESWDIVRFRLAGRRGILGSDPRGAGLSQKVTGALSIDTMTDDLVALLDALGLTGRVVLAGVAVGGAIALRTAVRHPQRVAAVVVSRTTPAPSLNAMVFSSPAASPPLMFAPYCKL